ncbi:MAG: hypothetical protein KF915_17135 [Polyangiaceae bacterium]|nr:hypothetical protein [Polyangiaceae bacterium]
MSSSAASDAARHPLQAQYDEAGIGSAPDRGTKGSAGRGAPPHALTLLYYWLLLSTALLATFHELVVRQAELAFSPGFGPHPHTPLWSAAAGVSLALLLNRRIRLPAPERLVLALIVSSLIASAAPLLLREAFLSRALMTALALSAPFTLGFAGTVVAFAAHQQFSTPARQLGSFGWLLDPFRLLALTAILGAAAAGAAVIGHQRTGAFLGMLLAAAAAWTPTLYRHLYLDARRPRRGQALLAATYGVGALAALSLFAAERQLPVSRLGYYPGELIYSSNRADEEIVITSSQRAYLLFVGGQLRRAQLDGYRYVESLVEPAMALSEEPRRVLVLGGGDGLLERAVLRHPSVEELVVVVPSRALPELARRSVWLARASQGALDDPRVVMVEDEPAAFVSTAHGQYDVILADLPRPLSYEHGKHYTRYVFERLAELLTEGGTLTVSATSGFMTPESHGSVVATLRTSGLNTLEYQVGVPLLGELSLVLAGRRELHPPEQLRGSGHAFLTEETLPKLFTRPPDTRSPPGEVNLLHHQPLVELYRSELGLQPTGGASEAEEDDAAGDEGQRPSP